MSTIEAFFNNNIKANILFDQHTHEINRKFTDKNATPPDLSPLKNDLNSQKQAFQDIERGRAECENKFIASKTGKWTVRLIFGFSILATIAAAIAGIYVAIITNDNRTVRNSAIAFSSVTGAGAIGTVAFAYFKGEQDSNEQTIRDLRTQRLLLSLDNRIENLVFSYERLRTNNKKEEANEDLYTCMKAIRDVPDADLKAKRLPPKPLWVEQTARLMKVRDPDDEAGRRMGLDLQRIATKCTSKPEIKRPFQGEQGGSIIFEPIDNFSAEINAEFARLDESIGFKVPYISYEGKYYCRDGKIFDSYEEAEANSPAQENLVLINRV